MQPFVISIGGLRSGRSHYEWKSGVEFFKAFENPDILDAELEVALDLVYTGDSAQASCNVHGYVVVPCDRCLERLTLPVDTGFELGEDEIDISKDLDFSQDVYDFVCISLPMQRIHPDGECNEDTIEYLSK